MALMDIVRSVEGTDYHKRKDAVYKGLFGIGASFKDHHFKSGTNIIASVCCETGKRLIGVSSHYDAVAGSPGANDNASAVAVTMEVIKRFIQNPPKNIGVMGFFFDCEEKGLIGSRNYVNTHSFELRNLYGVYNMELVGCGNIAALWNVSPFEDNTLAMALELTARKIGIETYRFNKVIFNSADHVSFRNAGKQSFTLTTITEEDKMIADKSNDLFYMGKTSDAERFFVNAPLFRHYHKPSDRSEYLDETTLQVVSNLVEGAIRKFDSPNEDKFHY
jgi:hypothetical protein